MSGAALRRIITISRRTCLAIILGLLASASANAQPTMLDPVVTQIGSGSSLFACALTTTGGVKCWGYNPQGLLGDGTTEYQPTPRDVLSLQSGVVSLGQGLNFTCALTITGGVKCWGSLPNTSGTISPAAVDVSGLTSGVASLSGGAEHMCALTTAGGVKCWGRGDEGQIGNGTATPTLSPQFPPADVVGLTSGVVSISSSGWHTCALMRWGAVKCWGRNVTGQLGDGTTTERLAPVDVLGLPGGVTSVSAGASHTCVTTMSGGAKCWGDNQHGELGDGTNTQRLTPINVSGLASGVLRITAGPWSTCAATAAGIAKCWGRGATFGLPDRSIPADVEGLAGGVTSLAFGLHHICALTTAGGVQCWGAGIGGALGNGGGPSATPVHVAGLAGGVSRVAAGEAHTCAVTSGGGAKCWGNNAAGQLGDGTTTDRFAPVDVPSLTHGVASLAAGGFHTCALTTGGTVKCWGQPRFGQVPTVDGTVPVEMLADGVQGIAAGWGQTCALMIAGGVKCWTGYPGDPSGTPEDVPGLTSGVIEVVGGQGHTCALTAGGGVYCWGANEFGQLGDDTTVPKTSVTQVSGLTSGVAGIAAGYFHSCAMMLGGGLKCWGNNEWGELGDGTTIERHTPIDVSGLSPSLRSAAGGYFHTCAVTIGGGATCWGFSQSGQLGDGTFAQRLTPVDVLGLTSGVSSVTAGIMHSCAVMIDGGLKCWGNNGQGRLGDGTAIARTSPVAIRSGQSIAFIPPVSLSPGGPIPLDATSSSGLPVIFNTWTPGACSIVGNSVVAGAAALCGIRASQAGDFNNAPAPQQLHLVPILTPTISIADVTLPEGNSGTTNAVFTVTLSAPSPETVTVLAITSDQSATAGSDYSATGPQTLTFPPTTTTQTFSVPVSGDGLLEGDETFLVTLSNPTNALIADAVAVGTIANDEPPSRVFVSSSGSDAANCSVQATPCRNLAAAIGQVAPDGEVIVLFSGEYDTAPLMIDKGLKITTPTGTVALLRHPILVNAPGGRVVLRGLTLKGGGAGTAVLLTAADSLSIEDTSIEGWGGGLNLASAAASRVSVLNAVFRANTSGILDSGGAPGNRVSIVEARFEGNTSAVEVSAGGFAVRESMFAGNATGVSVGPGTVEIRGAAFAFNGTAVAALSGGTVGISRSWIFGNTTGLSAAGGSVLNSAGTNVIRGNLTDTTGTITTVPEQ